MASTDKVHLDLDTVERDPKQSFEVFAFTLNGRRIEITDPADIDYQDLLNCETPAEFLQFTMAEDDREYLRGAKGLKGWRFGLLLEAYLKHYKAAERLDDRKKLGF